MLEHLKRLEMKRIHRIMRDPEGNGPGFLDIEEPA
jgi:hypothetical protein